MAATGSWIRAVTGLGRVAGGLGLAICLGVSAWAAPPASSLLAAGMVGQGAFGTVKGRLVWGGDTVPPARVEIEQGKATKDGDVCAKDQPIPARDLVVDPKTKGVANGFVYLVRPKGANPEAVQSLISKAPQVVLDQANCQFMPFVLAMHQNQALVIKSSDPKGHNVRFSAFNNGGFNQIIPAQGTLKPMNLVAERFPIELRCDIHPWMKGYLMVFDHPFFAITGPDGSFEIKGVPPGAQNLVARQETVGWVTAGQGRGTPITVKAGEVTDVGEIKVDPAKVKLGNPAK